MSACLPVFPVHVRQGVALYGLFIMWAATRLELRHYHTTVKFAVVKLLVFVGVFQRYGLHELADLAILKGDGLFSPNAWASLIYSLLLAVESPLLYMLITVAFPSSELMDVVDEDFDSKSRKTMAIEETLALSRSRV